MRSVCAALEWAHDAASCHFGVEQVSHKPSRGRAVCGARHPLMAPAMAPLPAHSCASVRCVTASRFVTMNCARARDARISTVGAGSTYARQNRTQLYQTRNRDTHGMLAQPRGSLTSQPGFSLMQSCAYLRRRSGPQAMYGMACSSEPLATAISKHSRHL
eukprot:6199494-Pleurochrysis_carterae.AAC.5